MTSPPKKSLSSSVKFDLERVPASDSPRVQRRRVSGPSGLVWRGGSETNPPSRYKRKSILTRVDEDTPVEPTNFRENRKSLLKYNRPEASNEVEARLRRSSAISRAASLDDVNSDTRLSLGSIHSVPGRKSVSPQRVSISSTFQPRRSKRFSMPAQVDRRRSSGRSSLEEFLQQRQTRSLSVGAQPRLGKDSLGHILPLKTWQLEQQYYMQLPSTVPATRLDIETLQEDFDSKLKDQGARETGICPVRRAIYDQCFDEIIREVSINCAERGMLLTRVKNEVKMTMSEYETLYQSSIGYGMRRALGGQKEKTDVIEEIENLKNQVKDLKKRLQDLREESENLELQEREKQFQAHKEHKEAVDEMNQMNAELKSKLKNILGAAIKF